MHTYTHTHTHTHTQKRTQTHTRIETHTHTHTHTPHTLTQTHTNTHTHRETHTHTQNTHTHTHLPIFFSPLYLLLLVKQFRAEDELLTSLGSGETFFTLLLSVLTCTEVFLRPAQREHVPGLMARRAN